VSALALFHTESGLVTKRRPPSHFETSHLILGTAAQQVLLSGLSTEGSGVRLWRAFMNAEGPKQQVKFSEGGFSFTVVDLEPSK